ncbi:MAG: SRPBCC family protein [Thermoleophilia bacterium]|nr:SRPBCC family protein [Thermoleophilia bacterium]MDH3725428.1 SRPBCC family protein [Thermoleophilia bacterium]
MRFVIPTPAPRERAFEAVADFGRLEEWEPTIASSSWTEGAWPSVGSRVCLITKPWFSGAKLVYPLDSLEPGRSARHTGGTEPIRSVDTITCVKRPTGSVVIIQTDLDAHGAWSPLAPVIRLGIGVLGSAVITPAMRGHLENLD